MLTMVLFWVSLSVVVYTYLGYPLLLCWSRWLAKPWRRQHSAGQRVSVVIAARNEQIRIANRVSEILKHMFDSKIEGEILVVSDGSTDQTVEEVEGLGRQNVRVVELKVNAGKAVAINEGHAQAVHDIVVLADCRQRWKRGALATLISNFADPKVGAVSGELVLEESKGTLKGVGLYWRLEKWMRKRESLIHSCVGVTGAMCAVRRELLVPIPKGTILDDVYWPIHVAFAGFRVVHDDRARSFDRLPPRPRDEFRRKVRTLAGNFQLVRILPSVFRPWRNPVFIPFMSHKLMRLAVPWAMLVLLITGGILTGPFYLAMFSLQLAFYGLALLGFWDVAAKRLPGLSAASAFVLLNAACFIAFFVWCSGRGAGIWRPVSYESTA